MSDLIESRVSEIRARLAAATPGPWEAVEPDQNEPIIYAAAKDEKGRQVVVLGVDNGISGYEEGRWIITDADHALMVHAPSDLEALLAEREGMKAEITALKAQVEKMESDLVAMAGGILEEQEDAHQEGGCWIHDSCEERCWMCTGDAKLRGALSVPLDPSSAPSETPEAPKDPTVQRALEMGLNTRVW